MKALPDRLPLGCECEHPCPDCGGVMALRESRFGLFYGCENFPACRATHGAHPDGKPLGIPADRETKKARIAAHKAFDRMWRGPKSDCSRGEAYRRLQLLMNLSADEAHIGRFTKAQCEQLGAEGTNDVD